MVKKGFYFCMGKAVTKIVLQRPLRKAALQLLQTGQEADVQLQNPFFPHN